MNLKLLRVFSGTVLAGALLAGAPAEAQSLAGKVGDKRYAARFQNTEGPCKKAYEDYVRAAGHSAYAQTHVTRGSEAFFCGRAYNAPSQKVAEERALADCNSLFKHYKVKTTGRCEIYASK